jgi:hypothetical protein
MKRAKITEELAYGTALDRFTGTENAAPVTPAEAVKPAAKPAAKPAPAFVPPEPAMTNQIKLSVFLNRDEDAYLENLSSTAKFSGGKKLSKTKLIEAMVRSFKKSSLDVRGVKDEEELLKRVDAQLRQTLNREK